MGQAVYKLQEETTNPLASAADMAVNQQSSGVGDETVQVKNASNISLSSSSSPWLTDPPTRTSSKFSEPTGYSSFVTRDKSNPVSLNGLQETQDQVKASNATENYVSSSSSASLTSQDHPRIPSFDCLQDGHISENETDRKWQDAVNVFLKHDPVAKTPKPRTRAQYLIRRNYCYIKRDTGCRWKKAVETFRARQYYPSIPIPNSEWSVA